VFPSRNHCCRGKALSSKHSGCVVRVGACVVLFVQRVCARAVLSSVARLTLPCFSTLSHKRHDFRKKKKKKRLLNMKCTF
jgi:hypothetical protein